MDQAHAEPNGALLHIKDLKTYFDTDEGVVQAVDGVDLAIGHGETVCVVGESGCGKTVTALSVLKLIAMPPGRIVGGQILWQGRDLVPMAPEEMNRIRAKEIAIVFQEPMTSLNPVYTIGDQIGEVIALHEGLSRRAVLERTIEMLALVQIPNPKRRVLDPRTTDDRFGIFVPNVGLDSPQAALLKECGADELKAT